MKSIEIAISSHRLPFLVNDFLLPIRIRALADNLIETSFSRDMLLLARFDKSALLRRIQQTPGD